MSKVLFLDLEVDNRPYYGRFASPHHPDNYVVMMGWAIDDGPVLSRYFESKEDAKGWFGLLGDISDVDYIVCHNAKFEMFWILAQCFEPFLDWLKGGGTVLCTQLAEYLLSGQQEMFAELNDLAPKYGGTTKIDEVSLLWKMGKLTSEIDPALLEEYLAGEGGDIENTRRVFYGQLPQLLERGMWDMYITRSDSELYNAFCEHFGMAVDKEVALADKLKLEERYAAAVETINEVVKEHIPAEVDWSNTRFQLSAVLFGGAIAYTTRVPRVGRDGGLVYVKTDGVYLEDGSVVYLTDLKDDPDSFDWVGAFGVDAVRFKSGKRKGQVKVERVDTDEVALKNEDTFEVLQGLLTPPAEWLKSYTGAQKLRDGTPVYSTSEDAVKELLNLRNLPTAAKEILSVLDELTFTDKLLGTFYEKVDDRGNVTGMMQYITPEGRIHHNLNATATVTTRLSSTRPNLQNTPSGGDAFVKRQFVSRWGDDGRVVAFDYSNIEVLVLAELSNDHNLKEFTRSGRSMHTFNLANVLGKPYDEVNAILKDEDHPLHAEYNRRRENDMKPMEFSSNYGASSAGVAYAAGVSIEEAEAFLKKKAEAFPQVTAYHELVEDTVESNCTSHREYADDGTSRLYKIGRMVMPCGTTFTYRQQERTTYIDGRPTTYMAFAPTQMKNYQTQGTAGLVIQASNAAIIRHLLDVDFYNYRFLPINTVHDEDDFDGHTSVLEEAIPAIKGIMEDVLPRMHDLGYTDWDLTYPVGVSYGLNWQDQHDWEGTV